MYQQNTPLRRLLDLPLMDEWVAWAVSTEARDGSVSPLICEGPQQTLLCDRPSPLCNLEGPHRYAYGYRLARSGKTLIITMPARNPPTWAHTATPPTSCPGRAIDSVAAPAKNCSTNQ
jgi:hypothetical protein